MKLVENIGQVFGTKLIYKSMIPEVHERIRKLALEDFMGGVITRSYSEVFIGSCDLEWSYKRWKNEIMYHH